MTEIKIAKEDLAFYFTESAKMKVLSFTRQNVYNFCVKLDGNDAMKKAAERVLDENFLPVTVSSTGRHIIQRTGYCTRISGSSGGKKSDALMRRNHASMIAFCSMATALSLVIMLIGGIIPVATYAVPLICGLINLWVAVEFGKSAAWTTYAAVAILSLMIDFDKEAAFYYIFFGYYPIIKWRIDRMKGKTLVKIGLFAVSLVFMYLLLNLFFPLCAYTQEFQAMERWLLIAFGIATIISLLIYDKLLEILIPLYANRIQPKLKWLHRR